MERCIKHAGSHFISMKDKLLPHLFM